MDPSHDVPMALRAAYRLMHRQTNAWLADLGVTADQFVLLTLLEGEDGVMQQELVKKASSDPNTVAAMLALLEERGLVDREPHPKDGRALSVTMTSKGAQTYTLLAARLRPLQDRILSLFTHREMVELLELLERIRKEMVMDCELQEER